MAPKNELGALRAVNWRRRMLDPLLSFLPREVLNAITTPHFTDAFCEMPSAKCGSKGPDRG